MSNGHAYTRPITASKKDICFTLSKTLFSFINHHIITISDTPHILPHNRIGYIVETIDDNDMSNPLLLVMDIEKGQCWIADRNKNRCSQILTLTQGPLK